MEKQNYLVTFHTSGISKPIEIFIERVSPKTKAKILRGLGLLNIYGAGAGMPYVKKITRDLYELRIRGREECRLLFSAEGNKICVLHAFRKKTNKIPVREIRLAAKRLTKL